ncbi:MAG: helix-turn-helix transcriptional regulator [Verrucomicrobia bacterium]|nr:helix-turn-helix transcriptional regulator [Verrucomicrobiota bacterium]
MDAGSPLTRLYQTLRSLRCRPEEPLNYQARVLSGLETYSQGQRYRWHGREREGDAEKPFLVWQYTLAGQGAFLCSGAEEMVLLGAGDAFATVVPSDDVYFLPPCSPSWTFFWLIIDHSYIVQRIQARFKTAGQVWRLPPDSPLVGSAVDLYDSVRAASLPDEFAEEDQLFHFLIEYERFACHLTYPAARRERLLADVRAEVLARMGNGSFGVSEIAAKWGMSRTHFSHHFRKTTGLSPGRFITQVKVGEVARLLMASDLKLAAIAEVTGFADATHLGKVFRKQFLLTPDRYRQLVR